MAIATSSWRHFTFAELFTASTGDTDIVQDMLEDVGEPVVSAGESNEGVVGRTTVSAKVFPPNTITIDMFGQAFAHGYNYKMVTHARVQSLAIQNHKATLRECLYLVALINFNKYKFAYGRMCNWERIKGEHLLLPAIFDARRNRIVPNWQYMSDFVAELEERRCDDKVALVDALKTSNIGRNKPIGSKCWGKFRISELFDVRKGKRLTKEDQTDGVTPYVGAIDSNNGVSNYIGQKAIHEGGTISLSYNGSVGEAFYQPEPFWATDDVNVLYPKSGTRLNPSTALFICTILRQEKYRYSYGRKWVLEAMNETFLRLPKDKSGKVDWNEMERLIRSLPYGDRI